MKRLVLLLSVLLLWGCYGGNSREELDAGRWDPAVRSALNGLIAAQGGKDAYAVFDFDKTTIVHDIAQALWVYQVEHLRYADAPAHAFLDGIAEPSRELRSGVTFRQAGQVLQEEYTQLRALLSDGKTLAQVHETEVYLDFRARMAALLSGMDEAFGSDVTYLWMPGLLAGYTEAEAREVVKDAIADQLGKEKLAVEQWTSPDGQWSESVERGIWFPPETKDLYNKLSVNGITPYVCSASLELIVEVLACDPELGVGLPPEQVFGLRFVPGEKLTAVFDPSYDQPMKTDKVACILANMAPSHGNAEPVLVAGDSNGDVPMLSSFEGMRHGLIIDVNRPAESAIGQLATQARTENNKGRYLLQPAFAKAAGAVDGGGI